MYIISSTKLTNNKIKYTGLRCNKKRGKTLGNLPKPKPTQKKSGIQSKTRDRICFTRGAILRRFKEQRKTLLEMNM